ncbi:hypothetical protein OUHCRE2_45690 [Enterobacter asburiae]|nr:hypothetical protein TUM17556_13010 [Enterobacter asburiae]
MFPLTPALSLKGEGAVRAGNIFRQPSTQRRDFYSESFTTINGSISLSFFTTSESSPRKQVPP